MRICVLLFSGGVQLVNSSSRRALARAVGKEAALDAGGGDRCSQLVLSDQNFFLGSDSNTRTRCPSRGGSPPYRSRLPLAVSPSYLGSCSSSLNLRAHHWQPIRSERQQGYGTGSERDRARSGPATFGPPDETRLGVRRHCLPCSEPSNVPGGTLSSNSVPRNQARFTEKATFRPQSGNSGVTLAEYNSPSRTLVSL